MEFICAAQSTGGKKAHFKSKKQCLDVELTFKQNFIHLHRSWVVEEISENLLKADGQIRRNYSDFGDLTIK